MITLGDPVSSLSHILGPLAGLPIPPVPFYIYFPDLDEQGQPCFLSTSQTPSADCWIPVSSPYSLLHNSSDFFFFDDVMELRLAWNSHSRG